ncbi:MAG: NAD-reducing hydrogenase HoxS subunit gamma [Pseudomonadota bacterium]|jgi:[NiFe] hydrogenase diaphorase moiety small subunit
MEHGHIKVTIDGKDILAKEGQSIVQAARDNGIYVPTLCDFKSLQPAGTCRVCTVKVGGRFVSGCTTQVSYGMVVENESSELIDLRKSLIEMLFVEGNHMCPSCEKSGNCELQALAYRYRMTAPRFPFSFTQRKLDASLPHLVLEHNRCIQCLRCVRGVKAKDGHDLFGFTDRGGNIQITIDSTDPESASESTAQKAMDICPVGALIKKGSAYKVPIGERKYDNEPIGSDIEKQGEHS